MRLDPAKELQAMLVILRDNAKVLWAKDFKLYPALPEFTKHINSKGSLIYILLNWSLSDFLMFVCPSAHF